MKKRIQKKNQFNDKKGWNEKNSKKAEKKM